MQYWEPVQFVEVGDVAQAVGEYSNPFSSSSLPLIKNFVMPSGWGESKLKGSEISYEELAPRPRLRTTLSRREACRSVTSSVTIDDDRDQL